MAVKHSIKSGNGEVLVREENGKYLLSIQADANPLGFGAVLETFTTETDAIRAAEQFYRLLTAAKKQGYHLEDGHFVKPDCGKIPVSHALKDEVAEEQWIKRLNEGQG